jgi:hypothetical protein
LLYISAASKAVAVAVVDASQLAIAQQQHGSRALFCACSQS